MDTVKSEIASELASESVWLTPTLLGDLLTGALVAADKSKGAIDRCASVYLSYAGGEVKVQGTDRYRLVIGRAHVGADGSLGEVQIRVGDVKRILTLLKENKNMPHVALNRTGDLLEVFCEGNKVLLDLGGQTFPDASHVFRDTAAITGLSLNADYLGSFAKVPSSVKDSRIDIEFTTLTVGGESTPSAIKIKVPHDTIAWECALMSMRVR
jgi:hypothetical protein